MTVMNVGLYIGQPGPAGQSISHIWSAPAARQVCRDGWLLANTGSEFADRWRNPMRFGCVIWEWMMVKRIRSFSRVLLNIHRPWLMYCSNMRICTASIDRRSRLRSVAMETEHLVSGDDDGDPSTVCVCLHIVNLNVKTLHSVSDIKKCWVASWIQRTSHMLQCSRGNIPFVFRIYSTYHTIHETFSRLFRQRSMPPMKWFTFVSRSALHWD